LKEGPFAAGSKASFEQPRLRELVRLYAMAHPGSRHEYRRTAARAHPHQEMSVLAGWHVTAGTELVVKSLLADYASSHSKVTPVRISSNRPLIAWGLKQAVRGLQEIVASEVFGQLPRQIQKDRTTKDGMGGPPLGRAEQLLNPIRREGHVVICEEEQIRVSNLERTVKGLALPRRGLKNYRQWQREGKTLQQLRCVVRAAIVDDNDTGAESFRFCAHLFKRWSQRGRSIPRRDDHRGRHE
jgi:hypothetical protein